jgi:hypothetical protein
MSKEKLVLESVYSIHQEPDGAFTVSKNGHEVHCMYKQPLAKQTTMGQVELVMLPCTTRCPHCSIGSYEDGHGKGIVNTISITCNGNVRVYDLVDENIHLKEPKKEEQVSPGGIIH